MTATDAFKQRLMEAGSQDHFSEWWNRANKYLDIYCSVRLVMYNRHPETLNTYKYPQLAMYQAAVYGCEMKNELLPCESHYIHQAVQG